MSIKVVITGATSFLGSYIVEELIRRNASVYAIIRPKSSSKEMYKDNPFVTTILADMDNTEKWESEIKNADYFIHLGWAGTSIDGRAKSDIQTKNTQDTIKCINAAKKLDCKAFLFAGSQAEYGIKTEVITEETECNPVTEYGRAKLDVLRQVSKEDLENMRYYHTRIFSVYGEGDHKRTLVQSCIRTMCDGGEMQVSSCNQNWNFLYVADAASEICSLLFSDAKSGVYNIASDDTRVLREFVEAIYAVCNKKGTLSFGSYNPKERPANLNPDISKLKAAIGHIPFRRFETAVKGMSEMYIKTGKQ